MRLLISVLCLVLPFLSASAADSQNKVVIDRYLARCRDNQSLTSEVRQQLVEAVERHRHDPALAGDAISAGLKLSSPEFAAALQSLADENAAQAIDQLRVLSKSPDAFVAAEASYLLARTLMAQDRFEEALPSLRRLDDQQSGQSVRRSEALFLRGKAEAGTLKNDAAKSAFERFLSDSPDAPRRMRKEAEAALIDLEEAESDLLTGIHSKMGYSRRRLSLEDSGQKTQDVQEDVVALLTEMIEELEKKCGSCKGCKCSGGSKPGSGGGGGSPGQSNVAAQPPQITERDGTRTPWVDLQKRHDDPTAFNGAKKRLPPQYKDLIEQYYKSFNEKTK